LINPERSGKFGQLLSIGTNCLIFDVYHLVVRIDE